MDLPKNMELPYFAYGLFKPNEIAFSLVKNLLAEEPKRRGVRGNLWIRDGLPLLQLCPGAEIVGYILKYKSKHKKEAYEKIASFEPEDHYQWEEYAFHDTKTVVNILIGRKPNIGSILIEDTEWRGKNDPVFTYAIEIVEEVAEEFGRDKFQSSSPEYFDWKRLFKLQMAYLLLWTAIERYSSLSYGPDLKPNEKIRCIGKDEDFKDALIKIVERTDVIYDSRNPRRHLRLNSSNPASSINYYYQVRSNLSHRGKGAWKDGEIVRLSLIELFNIFQLILGKRIFFSE